MKHTLHYLSCVKVPLMLRGMYRNYCWVFHTGGAPGPDPLRRPPPPPSLLRSGPEVPDHGRRRRPKEILLGLVEGEKMGFHPMCLC